ncbi:MAG: sel1 repeat family protein [Sporolactobacillus sp.]
MNNLEDLFQVELTTSDDQTQLTFVFEVHGEWAGRKLRRHRAVSVQLFTEPEHKLLHVAQRPEQYTYFSGDGDLDFTVPMRQDRLAISLPQAVLPERRFGDFLSADISLDNEVTGDVLERRRLILFVGKGSVLDIASDHAVGLYLKSGLSAAELLAKAGYWIESNAADAAIVNRSLVLLKKLAEEGSLSAAEKIENIYSKPQYAVASQTAAAAWHRKIESMKQAEEAALQQKEAEASELPEKIVGQAALDKCERLAAKGNASADWLIYQYSLTSQGSGYDKDTAFGYLKSAAAGGHAAAVAALADAYARNYIFIAREQVKDYLSVLHAADAKNASLAQYLLFQIYYEGSCLGESVPTDKKTAYRMLSASAAGGHADAAYRLWQFFEDGNEFLMEEAEALKWLQLAADHGYPAAEARIGDLYIDGKLVKKDNAKGLAYIHRAAEQNNWGAQLTLSRSYYDGRYKDILFDQDKARAFALLRKYADEGNGQAAVRIMNSYLSGNEFLLEHREAVGYLQKAADAGYAPAMYELANLLLDGLYVPQELKQAKKLLEAAAGKGNADAQLALYSYFFSGYKTLKNAHVNRERAYKWLFRAAQTLPAAQYEIWQLSKSGNYPDLDITYKEALDFLFKSAARKYSPALYRVGLAFGEGVDVEKDTSRGITLIEEAVALHNPEAMYTLSQIRTNGQFGGEAVDEDAAEGLHLLLLSAEQGFEPACRQIGVLHAEGKLTGESEAWLRDIAQAVKSQATQSPARSHGGVKAEVRKEAAAAKEDKA